MSSKIKINKMQFEAANLGMTSIKCNILKMTCVFKNIIGNEFTKTFEESDQEVYLVLNSEDKIDIIKNIEFTGDYYQIKINNQNYKIYEVDTSHAYAGFLGEIADALNVDFEEAKSLLLKAIIDYLSKK